MDNEYKVGIVLQGEDKCKWCKRGMELVKEEEGIHVHLFYKDRWIN